MTTTLTRIGRTTVVGVAGTAVALSLAACGGSGTIDAGGGKDKASSSAAPTSEQASESPSAETTTQEATTSEAPSESASSDSSDSGAVAQKATEADIPAAKDVFIDFYNKMANGDIDGATALVYDSESGGSSKGSSQESMTKSALESAKSSFPKNAAKALKPDLFDAKVSSDGRVQLAPKGGASNTAVPMTKGKDGKMYVDLLNAGSH